MSRELRAVSTFSTHSFSDSTFPLASCFLNFHCHKSTSPAVQSSLALHSCLSWEQGSAPHDLEAQLAASDEEVEEEEEQEVEEEQEERQTEEQGAVLQVERQEERALRQQDAQKNLEPGKKTSPSFQFKPVILLCPSVLKQDIISAYLHL